MVAPAANSIDLSTLGRIFAGLAAAGLLLFAGRALIRSRRKSGVPVTITPK